MGMERQPSSVALGKQSEQRFQADFDEAAFERAFEAAGLEMVEAETQPNDQTQKDTSDLNQIQRDRHLSFQEPDPITFGYNVSHNPETLDHADSFDHAIDHAELDTKEDITHNDNEADELARTAGQLLDNLKDERSEKFQHSKFMELMRQLRDKEVRVEGDKMVDVSSSPSSQRPLLPPNPNLAQLYEQEFLEEEYELKYQHNHPGTPDFITCKVMQCEPREE